jgi:hypothetical protein
LPDLILGLGERTRDLGGRSRGVYWCRNAGTKQVAKFGPSQRLIADNDRVETSGISVADWNGDGRPDLIASRIERDKEGDPPAGTRRCGSTFAAAAEKRGFRRAEPTAEADRGRHPGIPRFNALAGGPGSLAPPFDHHFSIWRELFSGPGHRGGRLWSVSCLARWGYSSRPAARASGNIPGTTSACRDRTLVVLWKDSPTGTRNGHATRTVQALRPAAV